LSDGNPTNSSLINVRGSKVALGPYTQQHVELTVGFKQDPETEIYGSGTFEATTLERETERFDKVSKDPTRVLFAIYALEDLTFIGDTGLRRIDQRHGTATFGIGIGHKAYWSKGYGTEAAKLVLDYGFRFLNLYNIGLDTTSYNARAIRAYQKAGFKEIGRRRGAILLAGKRYDEVQMDCLASEFEAPQPGWFSL
jgi:RimJ/RimL family protein N-acetyltransferase